MEFKVAIAIAGICLLLYCAVVCTLFFQRRSKFPINGSSPLFQLALAANVSISCVFVLICEQVYPESMLEFFDILGQMFLSMSAAIAGIFTWFIFFQYRVAEDRKQSKDTDSWYLRNLKYGHSSFLSKVMLTAIGLYFVISVLLACGYGSFSETVQQALFEDANSTIGVTLASVVLLLAAVPSFWMAIFSWKMRSKRDGFYLVSCLFYTGAICGLKIVIWFVVGLVQSSTISEQVDVVIVLSACYDGISGLITAPLVLSYVHEKRDSMAIKAKATTSTSSSNPGRLGSLASQRKFRDVLDSPDLLEEFTAFLVSEFSVENILFYQEVKSFIQTCATRPQLSRDMGYKVYQKFICDGSFYQVNLSSPNFSRLHQIFSQSSDEPLDSTTFDDALEQILHLMETDSFRRFSAKALSVNENLQMAE